MERELAVKVWLHPEYLNLTHIFSTSRDLLVVLGANGVHIDVDHWNGTLEGVPPKGEPAIVMASKSMLCLLRDLAPICADRGHLLFYGDQVITSTGEGFGPPALR